MQDSEERAEGISSVEAREPRLELLWEWECPLSPSLDAPPPKVTCMAWNKVKSSFNLCVLGMEQRITKLSQDLRSLDCA